MTGSVACPRCRRPTQDGLLCDQCMRAFQRTVTPAKPGVGRLSLHELLPELRVMAQRLENVERAMVHRPGVNREAVVADVEQSAVPAMLRSKHGRITLVQSALPVDLDAADLYASVRALLEAAVAALRPLRRRIAGPVCGWCDHDSCKRERWLDVDARLGALQWLQRHGAEVRRWPGAARFVTEVVRAVARIEQLIDRRGPDLFLGPCDAPDVKVDLESGVISLDAVCGVELYATLGDPTIDCPACGTTYEVQERREWLLPAMRDLWARPVDIADALTSMELPVRANTLDQWISRDRKRWAPDRPWPLPYPPILQVGIDDDGRALYRFGDVLERVEFLRAERETNEKEATG